MVNSSNFPESPLKFGDIIDIVSFISSKKYNKIAVQLPDSKLYQSQAILTDILKAYDFVVSSRTNGITDLNRAILIQQLIENAATISSTKIISGSLDMYILADNTFSNCCVDELGAARVDVDCIIHLGPTCMSRTSRMPAFFVFDHEVIDLGQCAASLVQVLNTSKNVTVFFDNEFSHAIPELEEETRKKLKELEISEDSIIFSDPPFQEMEPCSLDSLPLSTSGLTWKLPEGSSLDDTTLVWIGPDGPSCALHMLTYNSFKWLRYDPNTKEMTEDIKEHSSVLRRRYFLVEKSKDANIVGIVVATLGVAGYPKVVAEIRKLISSSGRKSYTFLVGRPNPAKLANFPECEAFVLVACPHSVLVNSRDYHVPVITPFEAVLAFSRKKEWTGEYRLDFSSILDTEENLENSIRETDEEPRFSLIKGGYASSGKEMVEETTKTLAMKSNTDLVVQRKDALLVKGSDDVFTGSDYFTQKRNFKGLETPPNILEALGVDATNVRLPPSDVVEGGSGRASHYDNEGKK